ncbi:MAG: DNA mismatch repair endonuclease MutL [Thalassotalea sp.]
MSIAILPARLANQIAAGEVVERPASVIKELVENSIDAGATRIQIDIEKGGAKRIRITDNGSGIVKDELTLALSRHATSKIHNLDDLEAISSLGFRGEALASISSVARLTLTSKPPEQEAAWQAYAEGRDMSVQIQPAAHPDGTTIDVCDLFFNTPARRKFLRTEKTEFAHIEEVIKRIALANFSVTFVLNHNHKMVKTYRAVQSKAQYVKRIAAVCGQSFVNNAIAIDCQHDDIHLWGWIASPSYTRKQNDLCYSYVNNRMMRDKLINHAIRQAYGEFIGNDVYSAFVLFLSLDFKEVDVNVHPAKHEVRFHQGRYVHDFIYSVCHKALTEHCVSGELIAAPDAEPDIRYQNAQVPAQDRDYIQPLQKVAEHTRSQYQAASTGTDSYDTRQANENYNLSGGSHTQAHTQVGNGYQTSYQRPPQPSTKAIGQASQNYQQLMTASATEQAAPLVDQHTKLQLLAVHQEQYLTFLAAEELKLCAIVPLAKAAQVHKIAHNWQQGLTSQPLLLPVKIKLTVTQVQQVVAFQAILQQSGIHINVDHGYGQIRQFPALLRCQDVTRSFEQILNYFNDIASIETLELDAWLDFLAGLSLPTKYTFSEAQQYWRELNNQARSQLKQLLELNSVVVDLTSSLKQLPVGADNNFGHNADNESR